LGQTISLHFVFWYKLPKPGSPRHFDFSVIKNIGKFAAGMGVASIIGTIVYQLDKLIISKLVTIEQFGYYTLATNIAMLVFNISLPIYMAMFPSFTALVHNQQQGEVKKQFHFYSKLVAGLILPVSTVIFFFAKEVLLVWTKNPSLASNTAPLLQVLIIGTTLSALMVMPHTLLLANNRIRFMLYSHIIAGICIIPLIIGFIHLFGVKGGAWAVAILYAGYFIIQASLIIRQNLEKKAWSWYLQDNLVFLLICVAVLWPVSRFVQLDNLHRFVLAGALAILWALNTMFCMLSIKSVRLKIGNGLGRLRK
jgi:O-antigen/teichoic acid export membrane protein